MNSIDTIEKELDVIQKGETGNEITQEFYFEIIEKYIKAFLILQNEQRTSENEPSPICNTKDAALNIAMLYLRYAKDVLIPSISSGIIQNFKFISATELAILRISPIEFHSDLQKEKELNLELAFFISFSILIRWHYLDERKIQIVIEDHEIKTFITEHKKWLRLIDPAYSNPIFLNSQVWRLFFYLLKDRSKV